jgi:hypothetical protein
MRSASRANGERVSAVGPGEGWTFDSRATLLMDLDTNSGTTWSAAFATAGYAGL